MQDARRFISASGSRGLVCGVAAVSTVANWSGDSVDPETACSRRTRPPEWVGRERILAMWATIFTTLRNGICHHFDIVVDGGSIPLGSEYDLL